MGNSLLRVLFLPLYPETMPSSRLRVYQYLPYLKSQGIEATVRPALSEPWFSRFFYSSSKTAHFIQYGSELLGNLKRLAARKRYDVVFVQKGLVSTSFRGLDRILDGVRPRVIFDLDDAIYGQGPVEFRSRFLRWFQDPEQTAKISSRASTVIAGNGYLRSLALRYNSNVVVIPTPVDTDRFRPVEERRTNESDSVVIGWIGVSGTVAWLRLLEGVFRVLSKRYRIRVKVVTRLGRDPFTLAGTHVELAPWSYENEVREMEAFDIGVMPLPQNDWSRGKCSLKLLQYMAMGIPSVSQRIGMNCEVVEEGVDGFLATEADEWIAKLSYLIENPVLRQQMGEAARKKVVEKYSLHTTAPLLTRVLKHEELYAPV